MMEDGNELVPGAWRWQRLLVMVFCAVAVVAAVSLLAGCNPDGDCHPGDVKAGHGHVQKCGTDKKWHV